MAKPRDLWEVSPQTLEASEVQMNRVPGPALEGLTWI